MIIDQINLKLMKEHSSHQYKLNIVKNALGDFWQIPVLVHKGSSGPVFGITAALHGNELNGISVIHQLFKKIDPKKLKGTVILIPVLNTPGFLQGMREFPEDHNDLNRIMPGNVRGSTSEVYAYNIMEKIIKKCDFLVDLHTASFGRINSLYIRADLSDKNVLKMAEVLDPQIIVNKKAERGTLRGEATEIGIPTVTLEIGDPHILQKKMIKPSTFGIYNLLNELGMIEGDQEENNHKPISCKKSYWLYSDNGGILKVTPSLTDKVKAGTLIATIADIFGNVLEDIICPEDSYVIAKAVNPVCQVGSRVIHLGQE